MHLKTHPYWQGITALVYANWRCASLTLVISLVILTPLCGWLFACGCTWPGLGLDAKCNFYQIHAAHHCPWCASTLAGWGSISFSVMVGMLVSVFVKVKRPISMIYAVLLGVLAFVGASILSGILAAVIQGYPIYFT